MGQDFIIYNVDRHLIVGGGAKLGEFFFTEKCPELYTFHVTSLPKEVDEWLSRGSFASQPGPMGKLSRELLDLIFEALVEVSAIDDKTTSFHDEGKITPILELIMLSVTCKLMLTVGKSHILRLFTAKHAPNIGCRMICLGVYARSMPPGMLTAAEIEEIATTPIDEEDYIDLDIPFVRFAFSGDRNLLLNPDSDSWIFYSRRLQEAQGITRSRRQLYRKTHWPRPDPQHDLELDMIHTFTFSFRERPSYPQEPMVLCNLSKSEYIREEPLLTIDKEVTLLPALLSRICWTDDPSMSLACSEYYENKLMKGPWVGDRFQIFCADKMPAPKAGTVWKDVTNEVYKMLRHIWIREHGGSSDNDEDDDGDADAANDEDDDATSAHDDGVTDAADNDADNDVTDTADNDADNDATDAADDDAHPEDNHGMADEQQARV